MATKPKTADQVKEELRNAGQTITGWAKTHGYEPRFVIRLLNGYQKGYYGKGHEVAVKLGLKAA